MKIGKRILEDMLQELDGVIVIKTGRRKTCTSETMSPVDLRECYQSSLMRMIITKAHIHGVLCTVAENM